jgi:CHAT domain-containing protein
MANCGKPSWLGSRLCADLVVLRAMLKEGQQPAGALRAAQLELSRNPRWKAPFYWAGFALQGEWR